MLLSAGALPLQCSSLFTTALGTVLFNPLLKPLLAETAAEVACAAADVCLLLEMAEAR